MTAMLPSPARLYFQEVSVRDGFQIEPAFVPTDTKVDLVNALSRTGLAKIEVTSFTSKGDPRPGRCRGGARAHQPRSGRPIHSAGAQCSRRMPRAEDPAGRI